MDDALKFESVLNCAVRGSALARAVLDQLSRGETVVLNFAPVERVTPSFSNALVMSLLAAYPLDELRQRVRMINRTDTVAVAINESVRLYQEGVRLSTQQAVAA